MLTVEVAAATAGDCQPGGQVVARVTSPATVRFGDPSGQPCGLGNPQGSRLEDGAANASRAGRPDARYQRGKSGIRRIQAIIRHRPDQANARNPTQAGGPPRPNAAAKSHLAVAEYLLARGRRSRHRTGGAALLWNEPSRDWNYAETTPLHRAAGSGFLAVVEPLGRRGAGLNARQRGVQTPLMHAGQLETTRALLEKGTEVNARDGKGRTAWLAR